MEIIKPTLIEFESKYVLKHALKNSKEFRDKYINIFTNIFLFLLFSLIFGGYLFYKYKGKLKEEEIKKKNLIKKNYFFEKLQKYQLDKKKNNQNLITNLPTI